MFKLTKRSVEGLELHEKEYLVWDREISGFGVRVYPSGRKTYLVQYRFSGRTKRRTIGQHGILTAIEARIEARKLLGEVAKGGDPSEERRARLKAPTVSALCDRFLDEYVAEHCKPVTARDYKSIVRRCIKPHLGPRKVADITRADIIGLHHALRETPYQANRSLSVLSKMFNLAEDWGLRGDGTNPARRIKKFREEEKKRYLRDNELMRLGDVLSESLEGGTESIYTVSAIQLLVLTGCRLSEILTLRWEYVTPHHLELPDSKTGKRRIPLPSDAHEILMELPRHENTPYVIRGRRPDRPMVNLQKSWSRIRKQAGIEDVRLHDLRHTYASAAMRGNVDPFKLKEIMGHRNLQTTLRYAHLDDEDVRRNAEFIASRLAGSIRRNKVTKVPLRIVG
ncbi:MAG: tyrosine-type recombinase/integrase [Rhodobacteraceae bacterium]|nr:tyrosine-type recombinase/integrase [Paracoccaceae bacterium]